MNRLNGITILIADDNKLTLEAMTRLLEMSGASVSAVNNGEEVLSLLDKKPNTFDILLIDINMPVMDGITTTKNIRQDDRFDALPIIAATADSQPENQLAYYQIGMNGHIPKPVNLHRLCETILVAINRAEIIDEGALSSPDKMSEGTLKQQILARFGNNKDLIENLLPLYAQEFIQQLNVLKSAKNKIQVNQVLHALKGLSGTIGALDVFDYVCSVQHSAKANGLNKQQMAHLIETLPQLQAINLKRLQDLFINTEQRIEAQQTTSDSQSCYLKSVQLNKIKSLLSKNDLNVIQYLKAIKTDQPDNEKLAQLMDYVDQLKFKQALNYIQAFNVTPQLSKDYEK